MIKDDLVRYVEYKLFNQLIELPIKAGEMLSLLVTLISLYVLPDQFEVHTQVYRSYTIASIDSHHSERHQSKQCEFLWKDVASTKFCAKLALAFQMPCSYNDEIRRPFHFRLSQITRDKLNVSERKRKTGK